MYCGYAAATLALRAKPSLSHSHRLALLDDGRGDELFPRGFSINPRFLLYGYYLRQSSLIYWSPLRTFLAGHGGNHCSRLSLRDDEPCAPRMSAMRGGCTNCCCCRSSQRRFQMIVQCCTESFGGRMRENDADHNEFDHPRRYAKREFEIRSDADGTVRSLRARRDGSSSVCPSCGHENGASWGRKVGGESSRSSTGKKGYVGKKANAGLRKVRGVWNVEDDVDYVSSEEPDYTERDYNLRASTSGKVSSSKIEGRETKLIASSHREKEYHHFEEEDEVKNRGSWERSQKFARISEVDKNVDVASGSKNMADLKVDMDKRCASSVKQQGEVDQRILKRDKQELIKRIQRDASWSVSAHGRSDEDYHQRQNIVGLESREGSRTFVTVSDVHGDDTLMASRSKNFVDKSKVGMAESSSSTLTQQGQVDKRVVRQAELKTDVIDGYFHNEDQVATQRESREGSQKIVRISEVHEDNAERISSVENVYDTGKMGKEHSSTSTLNQHAAVDQLAFQSHGSREHLQNLRQMKELHSSNIQLGSNIERRHEEVLVKNRDDKLVSVHMARDKKGQADQKIIAKRPLGEQYEKFLDVSRLQQCGTENTSSSNSLLQSRVDDEDCSTSTVSLVHQVGKHQNQSENQYTHQSSLRRESGKNTYASELSKKDSGRISTAQVIYRTHMKNELDDRRYSSKRESKQDFGISEYSVTDIQRDSDSQETSNMGVRNQLESSSLLLVQDEQKRHSQRTNQEITSSGYLDSASSSLYTHMQQPDDHNSQDEMYLVKNDALDSAGRLESSSAVYVDEFVDKLRQETSSYKMSSGTQTEGTRSKDSQSTTSIQSCRLDATTKDKEDKYIQEGSRRSSRSGTGGPSDEMWNVRNPTSQEDNRTEEPGEDGLSARVADSTNAAPIAERTVARRSSKSLWAHIADIIRMGWVHRAESHTSVQKSGKRSSSEGSEAWFSGQDASDDENDANRRSSALKELLPVGGPTDRVHETHSSFSQGSLKAPDVMAMQLGSSASSSLGIKGGCSSTSASTDSRPAEVTLTKNEKGTEGLPSSAITVDQSLTGVAPSVTIDEGIAHTGNLAIPVSGYMKLDEAAIRKEPLEADKTAGKDGELKNRKLQRNKQVLQETFEEWEEAYRLESEQRKTDEFFMREALVEAQKAADIWEVPVGAVLVQNGKIIARGYNLVEERRDATAHAEMICIREASNLLRTWRLAVIFCNFQNCSVTFDYNELFANVLQETTLYVTLEPCPMCAGAILQARIDTVVWGAPNKLLGADGSWVRLFPGDNGGSNISDPSNQKAGPVHPFHPDIRIRRGVLTTECSEVLQQFFQLRRKKKKQDSPPQSCLPVPNRPAKLFAKMHNIFSIMFRL
ncbi:hypothetical protein GW17_00002900 [Ensete ventricosum]|nr:hypothetical protein GW17_00002900 [Ensete ventricosum]